METEILFEEIQGTDGASIRNFFKVTTGIFIGALAFNLVLQKGNINHLAIGLIIGIFVCIIAIILSNIQMVTQIRTDGIYIRFSPFQPSFKKYYWDNIEELYIRKYDALKEYYGWGIRYGPMGIGYIVSGDTGIQIVFNDNNRVLISTQRPEEFQNILSRLG